MRHTSTIIFLLFCQNLFGQINFGTYSQLDSSLSVNLTLLSNHNFQLNDSRNSSCWLWTNYNGKWNIKNDTIIFSWKYIQTEQADTIYNYFDKERKSITMKFVYDDGEPIKNVKASYYCPFQSEIKYYYSDRNGNVLLPRIGNLSSNTSICANDNRLLNFEIKSKYIEINSSCVVKDTATNKFEIVVKKKRKSKVIYESKKYIISKNRIIDIDFKENSLLNWGDLIFYSKKYGR